MMTMLGGYAQTKILGDVSAKYGSNDSQGVLLSFEVTDSKNQSNLWIPSASDFSLLLKELKHNIEAQLKEVFLIQFAGWETPKTEANWSVTPVAAKFSLTSSDNGLIVVTFLKNKNAEAYVFNKNSTEKLLQSKIA
jgi:hypothetical protein